MRISAAACGFTFSAHNRPVTFRTGYRHREFFFFACSFFENDPKYFRNDFACFIDDNVVTYADILFLDKIFVMQRSAADGAARQPDWRQHCCRRQNTRASDLQNDILDSCFRLFRREFKSNSPTRIFACRSQQVLLPGSIDLHDNAVGIISQSSSHFFVLFNQLPDFFNIFSFLPAFADAKTKFSEHFQRFSVGILCAKANSISKKAERSFLSYLRIELP